MRIQAALALALAAAAPCLAAPAASLAELDAKIAALPKACSSDGGCASAAVGHSGCGGPSGFVAFAKGGDGGASGAKLAREQSAAAAAQPQSGPPMASVCIGRVDPGARCVAGMCELAGSALYRAVPEPPGVK